MADQQRWRRRRSADDAAPAEPVEARPVTAPARAAEPSEAPATEPAAEPVAAPGRAAKPVADASSEPSEPAASPGRPSAATRLRRSVLDATPVTLLLAAHPRQAVLTAAALGGAALAADRPGREAAVVAATALVGQTILGWHNDIVDRERDARHGTPHKPVADGRLDVGTVWFAVVVAVLLVVPLSISTGVTAGTIYLVSLAIGLLGNVALRSGIFSWVPWAASYALLPAYLSYGGWGGDAEGAAPEVALTVLAALLGVGVHVLRSIWGLVGDDADGWSHLPLRAGRRIGATRLLVVAGAGTAAVVVALVVVAADVGLRQ